jgi:hypothetical protein
MTTGTISATPRDASGLYPSDDSILNCGQCYGRKLSMDTNRRYVGQRAIISIILAMGIVLLIVGSLVFSVAARVDIMPQVDLHLTLDGRHALVIHNDLPCVPKEPPQMICGADEWRPEFKVTYSTPAQDRVLIAFALPEP